MPIVNYTTTVPVEKTLNEIQKRLSQFGASRIVVDYEGGRPRSLSFSFEHPDWGTRIFTLPADAPAMRMVILKQTRASKNSKQGSLEQAERVAWRIVKDWLAAQLALVESTMITLPEIMLPYMVMDLDSGATLRQAVPRLKVIEA